MLIISVVGGLSSGKTTIARIFAKKLNCKVIEISSLVKKFTKSSDRRKLQDEIYKHKDNVNWLYDEWVHELNSAARGFNIVVVSGIREPILLCKIMGSNVVVSVRVVANDFIRYKRLVEREGYISPNDFRLVDKKDRELGLDITMSMSDYSIDSVLSLNAVEKCVEQILIGCGQTPVYYKND